MRPNAVRLAWLCLLGFVGIVGCESPGVRFLNFITLQKNPLVCWWRKNRDQRRPAPALNPFAIFGTAARDEPRPAANSAGLMFSVPTPACLETGLYHAAVVSPIQYAAVEAAFPVIAVPAGERPIVQPALVVPAIR